MKSARVRATRGERHAFRPALERLEDRLAPANFITVDNGTGALPSAMQLSFADTGTYTIGEANLEAALNAGNVTLQANNDIIINSGLVSWTSGFDLTLQAGRSIQVISTNVMSSGGGDILLTANETAANGVQSSQRQAGAADIMTNSSQLNTRFAGGNVSLTISTGAGLTNNTSGAITAGILNAGTGTVQLINNGPTAGSDVSLFSVTAGTLTVQSDANPLSPSGNVLLTGISYAANNQSYRAGNGTGTASTVDLTTNNPAFGNTSAAGRPVNFTVRQDAAIADANLPAAARFPLGIPTNYTIQSDGGSVTVGTPGKVAGSNLMVQAATTISLPALTGANALASLVATTPGAAANTISLNGDVTTTAAAGQTYNGPVVLVSDLVLDGGAGPVTFGGTVESATASSLTVNTTGITTFGGVVGGDNSNTRRLGSLTTNAGGSTQINGGSINTSGFAQTYNDDVTLGQSFTLLAGDVFFNAGLALGSTPFAATSTLQIAGTLNFASTTTVTTTFAGTAPAQVGHVIVSNLTNFNNATLDLNYSGFTAAFGDSFDVVSNGAFSVGQFANAPAPGPVVLNGTLYVVTYSGSSGGSDFILAVAQAPAITSADTTTFTFGSPGTFTVTATGLPAPTFSLTGAPPWLSIDSTTGVMSGTPTAAGQFPFTVTATNGVAPDATQSFTLNVNPAATTTTAANAKTAFSAADQSVTLSATVSSSVPVNEGTVTFAVFQGTTQIGSSVTSGTVNAGSASASYPLPGGTAVGTYTIVATYDPGADFTTSSDNTHTLDVQPVPTATLTPPGNVLAVNANDTSKSIIVTYNAPGVGIDTASFATSNITVDDGATAAPVTGFSVSGNTVTYTIAAPGGTWGASPQGSYAIGLVGNPGGVKDLNGNFVVADPAFGSFRVDTTPLSVTINQGPNQSDPTTASPIAFRVVFNKPVFGFQTGDVTLSGTAGATTADVSPVGFGGVTWNVRVSGMTTSGTVIATIDPGVATDLAGNPNLASTSTDNTVTFDLIPGSIALVSGNNQSVPVTGAFAPLVVQVNDQFGNPLSGSDVTFTAPSTGAGGTFAGGAISATVATNATGQATAPVFTANSVTGSFTVTAAAGSQGTSFALTNQAPEIGRIIGASAGQAPVIQVLNVDGSLRFRATAFDPNFTGGVTTALGDVTRDGVPDVIVGAGPGGGPSVAVYNGLDGTYLYAFFAFDSHFTGGVNVAVGDVNRDGFGDLIVGAGAGGGPNVVVVSGKDHQTVLDNWMAFDPAFTGGVSVGSGDVTGDGFADVVVGAGPGGGPSVAVFDGRTGNILASYFAYDPAFTGGVLVAAGAVRGAGVAQVLAGPGAGGGPTIEEIDALSGARLAAFFAYPQNMTAGVRVGLGRAISDNRLILLTGQGAQATTFDTGFDGLTQAQIDQFFLAPGA